jgi:hypothetical protein
MVAWQPEDDIKIMELHRTLGPRWSAIASRFPGRTVSSIRNRFLRLQTGQKIREAGQITKNRCQLCGQPKKGHTCGVKLQLLANSANSATGLATLAEEATAAITLAPAAVAAVTPSTGPFRSHYAPLLPPTQTAVQYSSPAEVCAPSAEDEIAAEDESLMQLPMAEAEVGRPTPPRPPAVLRILSAAGIGLPTSSPLTHRPQFNFEQASAQSESAFEPDEPEMEAAADDMMNDGGENQENTPVHRVASASVAAGPCQLMVDIMPSSYDEDGPSTPAAA